MSTRDRSTASPLLPSYIAAILLTSACRLATVVDAPTGCGQGQTACPGAVLTVSPSSATVEAGAAGVTLSATLVNARDAITWTLNGPGALAQPTASSVAYSPPSSLESPATATVTARAGALTASAVITVNPGAVIDTLEVAPAAAEVAAGGPGLELTATIRGVPAEVSWTLSGPGSLSATRGARTVFLPPATVAGAQTATVTALQGTAVAHSTITITPPPQPVATPTFSPPAGSYGSAQSVTIATATSDATIFYSVDGTTPGLEYGGPVTVSTSLTLRAFARRAGLADSPVASASYQIAPPPPAAATPQLRPPPGTFTTSVAVELSCATTGSVIHYTVDGSSPSHSSSTYATALTVRTTTTIRAICAAAGHADSQVVTGTYTIAAAPSGDLLAIPMGVPVSRRATAYASAGRAADANSADYTVGWRGPANGGWLAYDLSAVPAAERTDVLVQWQVPNAQRYDYRWDANPGPPHTDDGIPGPFVLEASADSTNGRNGTWATLFADPAVQEWKTRVVRLGLGGYSWLRFRGTGANGTFGTSSDVYLKLDVYDASVGDDSIAMFGDSITGEAWRWEGPSLRVNAVEAAKHPLVQPSGIAFLTTSMVLEDWWEYGGPTHPGVSWFDRWLALYPGKYVSLAYGTNDTNGAGYDRATFVANMRQLLRKTIAAGKVPILPGLPWNAPNQAQIEDALAAVGLLRAAWVVGAPQPGSLLAESEFAGRYLVGPDLYFAFRGRNDLIEDGGQGLHPTGTGTHDTGTSTGYGVYRQTWADWIRQNLYESFVNPGTPGACDVLVSADSHATRLISPYVFGVNFKYDDPTGLDPWAPGTWAPEVPLTRFGGNTTSTIDWRTGYGNFAGDWGYLPADSYTGSRIAPGASFERFYGQGEADGTSMLWTVPMLPYVARFGSGAALDANNPNQIAARSPYQLTGEGINTDADGAVPADPGAVWRNVGKNPRGATATPATTGPSYADDFVKWLSVNYPGRASARRGRIMVALDNEPDNWCWDYGAKHGWALGWPAHSDSWTVKLGHAYHVNRTLEFARAIKDVSPDIDVFGGVFMGYWGLYSLGNMDHGRPGHGMPDTLIDYSTGLPRPGITFPYLELWAKALHDASAVRGARLVDVVDFHWYHDAFTRDGRDAADSGRADADEALLDARMQAPRAMWDPTYRSNSEIEWKSGQWGLCPTDSSISRGGVAADFLHRLQTTLAKYPQGPQKLAITEYQLGRAGDISGAIAQADILGVFAREGVYAATMWPMTHPDDPGYRVAGDPQASMARAFAGVSAAFKAWVSYDGAGAGCGDTYADTTVTDADRPADPNRPDNAPSQTLERVTAYASFDQANPNRMVIVAINKATTRALTVGFRITHTRAFTRATPYQITGRNGANAAISGPTRLADITLPAVNAFTASLPAQSITVFDLRP